MALYDFRSNFINDYFPELFVLYASIFSWFIGGPQLLLKISISFLSSMSAGLFSVAPYRPMMMPLGSIKMYTGMGIKLNCFRSSPSKLASPTLSCSFKKSMSLSVKDRMFTNDSMLSFNIAFCQASYLESQENQ
ncbi:MAG: hypothetical protein ACTHKC_09150 [Candidatus Nitrosocosmicus sp.]